MTAKRLLLATTFMTSIASPVCAGGANVTWDSGTAVNVPGGNYGTATVGDTTTGNIVMLDPGTQVTSYVTYISREQTAAGAPGNSLTVSAGENWIVNFDSNVADAGRFYLGDAGSNASLLVESGGYVSANWDFILGNQQTSASNTATVKDENSSLSTRQLTIGNAGRDNTLTVEEGGAVMATENAYIGYDQGSTGNSATVSGVDKSTGKYSSLDVVQSLYVGRSGSNNQLTADNGGRVTAGGNFFIGATSDSRNNTVSVGGQTILPTLDVSGATVVGARTDTNSGDLPPLTNGGNQLNLSSATSVKSGYLYVGLGSDGNAVSVKEGAVFHAGGALIGVWNAEGQNAVGNSFDVSGAGSQFNTDGGILIGGIEPQNSNAKYAAYYSSNNRLLIENGGSVKSSFVDVGAFNSDTNKDDKHNSLTVTGQGSVLDTTDVAIGMASNGNSLTISGGGTVKDTLASVGVISDNNSASISGAGSSWQTEGDFGLGVGGGGNHVTVSNGATLSTKNAIIGLSGSGNMLSIESGGHVTNADTTLGRALVSPGATAPASDNNAATVSGAGSTLTSGKITVGDDGTGNSLRVEKGGAVEAGMLGIGNGDGSTGNTVTVSGKGSTLTSEYSVLVGYEGSGNSLTVEDGGSLTGVMTFLGMNSTENSLRVTGAGSTMTSTFVDLGFNGGGNRLSVENGGHLTSLETGLGFTADSNGNTASISGAGSAWDTTELFVLGMSGSENKVNVSDGGSLSSKYLLLGLQVLDAQVPSGNDNRLDISGTGSSVTSTDVFAVGAASIGNGVFLTNGATLSTGKAWIGGADKFDLSVNPSGDDEIAGQISGFGSHNEVAVSGAGSQWLLGGDLHIGDGAEDPEAASTNNQLTIAHGGAVRQTAGDVVIGTAARFTGNRIIVLGDDSSLTTTGNIQVGAWDGTHASASLLEIRDGGTVVASLPVSGRSLSPGMEQDRAGGGRVSVATGSTLAVAAGGTLQAASLNLASGSTLKVAVGDGSLASTIDIGGNAAIDGTLNYEITSEQLLQHSYSVLHAGQITGAFAATEAFGYTAIKNAVRYTDTDVFVDITANLAGLDGLNTNQRNAGGAIDRYFNNGGELTEAFTPLFSLTDAQRGNALSQLSGEPGATGGAAAAGQASNSFLSLLLGGFGPQRQHAPGMTHTAEAAQAAGAGIVPTADIPPAPAAGWSMWGSAYGGTADLPGDDSHGSHDTNTDAVGIATGWDYAVSEETQLGFALAGGGTRWDIDSGMGSGDSTFLQLGGYGSQQFGASYLSLAGAYAWHAMSTERDVNIGGNRENLDADFNASNLAGRAEAGHRFGTTVGLTPYAAFQAQAMYLPSYEENGGDYALDYDSSTATAARAELGLGVDGMAGATASLHARAAWAHDWVSDPSVNASFQSLPGANFTVYGAEAPADLALISAGADMAFSEAASLSADFNGEFAEGYESYAGSLKLAYSW